MEQKSTLVSQAEIELNDQTFSSIEFCDPPSYHAQKRSHLGRWITYWRESWVCRFFGSQSRTKASLQTSYIYDNVDSILRGVGQIFFANNPITGIFFLLAIGLLDPLSCALTLIGCIASTLTAVFLGANMDLIRNGLFGYNGALIGAGIALFNGSSHGHLALLLITPFVASFTTLVGMAISSVLTVPLGVPVLTFPFQVVLWLWLLGCQNFTTFPLKEGVFEESQPQNVTLINEIKIHSVSGDDFLNGLFRGIGQVMFADSIQSGILIVIGLIFYSPCIALASIIGSALGFTCGLVAGAPLLLLRAGLYGFNPCLTCIALITFVKVFNWRVPIFNFWATFLTALAFAGLGAFFGQLRIPALTFPFTLVVWFSLLAGAHIHWLDVIPLARVSFLEKHWIEDFLERHPSLIASSTSNHDDNNNVNNHTYGAVNSNKIVMDDHVNQHHHHHHHHDNDNVNSHMDTSHVTFDSDSRHRSSSQNKPLIEKKYKNYSRGGGPGNMDNDHDIYIDDIELDSIVIDDGQNSSPQRH